MVATLGALVDAYQLQSCSLALLLGMVHAMPDITFQESSPILERMLVRHVLLQWLSTIVAFVYPHSDLFIL